MVKHKIISILFLNSKRTNCNWYTTQVSIVTLKHSWGIQSTFRMSFLCCLLVIFSFCCPSKKLLDRKLRVCFDIERNRSIQIRAPKSWDWMIDRKAMGRLKSEILWIFHTITLQIIRCFPCWQTGAAAVYEETSRGVYNNASSSMLCQKLKIIFSLAVLLPNLLYVREEKTLHYF